MYISKAFPTWIPFETPIGMFEGFRYHMFFQQFESHCYSILEEPKKIQLLWSEKSSVAYDQPKRKKSDKY